MNGDRTHNVVGIARAMALSRAFEIGPQTKATLERGKGYMTALRKLRPGEEIFLSGAQNAPYLARRVFGKGNYRTRRSQEGTYVAYTPHMYLEPCPLCGAVSRVDDDRPSPAGPLA